MGVPDFWILRWDSSLATAGVKPELLLALPGIPEDNEGDQEDNLLRNSMKIFFRQLMQLCRQLHQVLLTSKKGCWPDPECQHNHLVTFQVAS